MWTGIGIALIICVLLISGIRWFIIMSAGCIQLGSDVNDVKTKLKEAISLKEELIQVQKSERIMSKSYHDNMIKEEPTSVIIGERYVNESDFIPQAYRYMNDSGDKTDSLYEYVSKIAFLGRDGRCYIFPHQKTDYYQQCSEYCSAVSAVVCRYICTIDNDEFVESFIRLLIMNNNMLLDFIKECHVINKWREDYKQILDCDNYLQYYIDSHDLQSKIGKISENKVTIPKEIRWYTDNSPLNIMSEHIKTERRKVELLGESEKHEIKSKYGFRVLIALTILCILIGFAALSGSIYTSLVLWSSIMTWCITAIYSSEQYDFALDCKNEINKMDNFDSEFAQWTNAESQKYSKRVYQSIKSKLDEDINYQYYIFKEE